MSLIEQTETVVAEVVNTLVESVVTEPVVAKEPKKSVKPKNVNAGHFKWMTFAYWMLRQMEATASESEMSSWMKMIGVGAATEDIKGFYDRFLAEQDATAETLVTVFEENAAEQKRGRKKKVISILPTYENGADADVVNANLIVKDLIQIANNDVVVPTEPVTVMTVADKPKRKYVRKPKATEPVVENVVTENVVENVVTENVVTENVITEPVAEKPKRKYVRKPKAVVAEPVVEPVVETVVTEPVVETVVVEPVVETVVTEPVVETVVTEPVVETVVTEPVVEKPKRKYNKKPKSDEPAEEGAEKPKRKTTKKPKSDVVVITPQESVPIVSELTNESYVSQTANVDVTESADDIMADLTNAMANSSIEDKQVPEQEEEQDVAVEIVIINNKKYLMDAEYTVYDEMTQEPIGKLVNGVIV